MSKRIDYSSTREEFVINENTGEINVTKIVKEGTYREVRDEPAFVKLYLDTVLLNKNISVNRNPILNELLKLMPYASSEVNYFALNKSIKERIAKQVDLSLQTVNNAITEFTKAKILLRLNRGLYQMNPLFFGKGDWKDIKKIRGNIEWSKHGITFTDMEIEKEDEVQNLSPTGTEG